MKSENTARMYLMGLNYFLKCLGYYEKTGRQRDINELDQAADQYLHDTKEREKAQREKEEAIRTDWHHIYDQLQQYILWMREEKDLACTTISNRVSAIRSFLAKNGVHIDNQVYRERVRRTLIVEILDYFTKKV